MQPPQRELLERPHLPSPLGSVLLQYSTSSSWSSAVSMYVCVFGAVYVWGLMYVRVRMGAHICMSSEPLVLRQTGACVLGWVRQK